MKLPVARCLERKLGPSAPATLPQATKCGELHFSILTKIFKSSLQ